MQGRRLNHHPDGAKIMPKAHIYVNGACRGNGRFRMPSAGAGIYFGENDTRNVFAPLTFYDNVKIVRLSKQRAELWACFMALTQLAGDCDEGVCGKAAVIHTDSIYVYRVMTEWTYKWAKNGYRTIRGEPVTNQDIIQNLVALQYKINLYFQSRCWDVLQFQHDPNHLVDFGNERAESLANFGADRMEEVMGVGSFGYNESLNVHVHGQFHNNQFYPLAVDCLSNKRRRMMWAN
ncbi:hypothetical protein DICA4_B04016 [Diutina catenulata]